MGLALLNLSCRSHQEASSQIARGITTETAGLMVNAGAIVGALNAFHEENLRYPESKAQLAAFCRLHPEYQSLDGGLLEAMQYKPLEDGTYQLLLPLRTTRTETRYVPVTGTAPAEINQMGSDLIKDELQRSLEGVFQNP
jgi:hypothetical protein